MSMASGVAPGGAPIERFRAFVAARLGLHFDEGRLSTLAEVLARRAARAERSEEAYLALLESGASGRAELAAVAQELTVTETYFFRLPDQLRAFSELALGARAGLGRRLRVLSAGCASGEEAYSLAMLMRDQLVDLASWEISILGVDICRPALERAARARYSPWSLRETSDGAKARWFQGERDHFVVRDEIRSMVRFEECNLADPELALFEPGAFDVVFCRNMLMYFTPQAARALVGRIARSLVPEGPLFLGHAETLRGLSHDFHLCHTHNTFYYRRRRRLETRAAPVVVASSIPAARAAPSLANSEDGGWIEAIRASSGRVRSLLERPSARAEDEPAALTAAEPRALIASLPVAAHSVASVVELVRGERFAEAKQVLSALSPEAARDPDVILLRAVLLTHGGDLAQAEAACAELLELDETSAGARYLLALCRENVGDLPAAVEHAQTAAYLDPSFALPRLHLGLLARRKKDFATARRELALALPLLEREESSRLLLFGGGFGREALIALCRAELRGCGGLP